MCADIRLRPVSKTGKNTPAPERVIWRWLIGPDSQPATPEHATVNSALTMTELDADLITRASEIFAANLQAGRVPGRRAIKKAMHVGDQRATIGDALAESITEPATVRANRELITRAQMIFAADLDNGATPSGTQIRKALGIGYTRARTVQAALTPAV